MKSRQVYQDSQGLWQTRKTITNGDRSFAM